jgi:hypothetical protein
MTARNDITGDSIATKTSTESYRDGWDRIFGKKKSDTNEAIVDLAGISDEQLEAHKRSE